MKYISIMFFSLTIPLATGCSFINNKARTAIQPESVYQPMHIAELAAGEADDTNVDLVALAGRFKTKLLAALLISIVMHSSNRSLCHKHIDNFSEQKPTKLVV